MDGKNEMLISDLLYRLRLLFPDPRFEVPRIWSNVELRKFAHLFDGSVVNVSAWRDEDKEGLRYKSYFERAREYWITNYRADARGWQDDAQDQVFLDLEQPLPADLEGRFDVVFNHTTLEHVFDVHAAFRNLCLMARDVVIVVVPFLQEQHGEYGDYWRFTPLCVERLFGLNGMSLVYISFNDGPGDAVYVFAVGVRDAGKWPEIVRMDGNRIADLKRVFIGGGVVKKPGLISRLIRQAVLKFLFR